MPAVPPRSLDPLLPLLPSDTERQRYLTLLEALASRRELFVGRRVLDFGASWGTSSIALMRSGAGEVVGVEPSAERTEQGRDLVGRAERQDLLHPHPVNCDVAVHRR